MTKKVNDISPVELADLERRCDEWLADPPADMRPFIEQFQRSGPFRDRWLAGEWLGDRLSELGATKEQAHDVCFANGQRSAFQTDPWVVAEASLAKFVAGEPDKPGSELAEEIIKDSPEQMQSVKDSITISDKELLARMRSQAEWIEAYLADGTVRQWEPHLMVWRRPHFGDSEQAITMSDFGNFNTDREKYDAMTQRGRRIAELPGGVTCVMLSSEAWASSNQKFHGGPVARVNELKSMAQRAADDSGKEIKLVRFTQRQEITTIKPRTGW